MPFQKAIPPVEAIQITFATAQAALQHKEDHGGWVAVSDQCSNGYWFDASFFTATGVMLHPVLSGKDARVF